MSRIAGHTLYNENLRRGKVWAEVVSGPSDLLSYIQTTFSAL